MMKGKRGEAPRGLMECEADSSAKQRYSGDGGESSTVCGDRRQHRRHASSHSTPSDPLLCSFQFGVLYYRHDNLARSSTITGVKLSDGRFWLHLMFKRSEAA